jgi:cobalt/nickel transport system ATP-binding protein
VTSETNIFDTSQISYHYADHFTALDQISMSIRAGERIALLGSNGSGKSTLLKLLDGLIFPTSGSITAFGKDLTEVALREDAFHYFFRSKVGLVFQDSDAQLFMPTVFEEVAFAPLQMGLSQEEVKHRVQEALAAMEIVVLADRAPHQLSGGEKKRVAFASILSLGPDVWLLDEPSAGLDPRSVSWVVEYLNHQAASGKTVILATHDLHLVEAATDRVYVLSEQHNMLTEGNPSQVLNDRSLLVHANLIRG